MHLMLLMIMLAGSICGQTLVSAGVESFASEGLGYKPSVGAFIEGRYTKRGVFVLANATFSNSRKVFANTGHHTGLIGQFGYQMNRIIPFAGLRFAQQVSTTYRKSGISPLVGIRFIATPKLQLYLNYSFRDSTPNQLSSIQYGTDLFLRREERVGVYIGWQISNSTFNQPFTSPPTNDLHGVAATIKFGVFK